MVQQAGVGQPDPPGDRVERRAVDAACAEQLESGVDIGSDGEEARVGFQTYASVRLSGWGGVSPRKGMTDIARFPKYGEMLTRRLARPGELTAKLFYATGPD